MKHVTIRAGLIVASCALIAYSAFAGAQEKETKPASSAELMRKKLEISKDILEGLATARFEKLAEDAKKLKDLTDSPVWKTPVLHNSESYPTLLQDFRRPVDEMIKQAKAHNIDGVTLAYVQVTMSCVSCHKFIREPKPN